MKISIITVVYNNVSTIQNTIQSVQSQNYQNIEHIIIDGNSTDGTLEVINKYKNADSIVISELDKGLYDAMNKGIKLATGDIIGILNSDDIFYNQYALNHICDGFIKHNTDSIFGDVIIVKRNNPYKIRRFYSNKNFRLWQFRIGNMPSHTSFFIKKKIFQKYGDYDINFKIAADFDLLFRFMYMNKISYTYIPKLIVRMSDGGISNQGLKSIFIMNKEIKKSLNKYGVPTNLLFTYTKYLIKIFQFVIRPKYN